MPGIVKQIAFLRSLEDFEEQKKLTDILIEPDLKGFPQLSFHNVDSIVERGYKAALPYKEYFRKLADSLNRIGLQRPLKIFLTNSSMSFDKIEITGNKIYSDYQILGFLDIEPGKKLIKISLTEKIDLLYGKTWFEKVKYRIIHRNDSLILSYRLYGRIQTQCFTEGVITTDIIRSGIVFRMTFKDLLTSKSLIDFDSFIGQYYRLRLSLLQFHRPESKIRNFNGFYMLIIRICQCLTFRNETGSIYEPQLSFPLFHQQIFRIKSYDECFNYS